MMSAVAQQLDAAVQEAAAKKHAAVYSESATMAELFGGLDGALALDAIVKTYRDPTVIVPGGGMHLFRVNFPCRRFGFSDFAVSMSPLINVNELSGQQVRYSTWCNGVPLWQIFQEAPSLSLI